MKLPPAGNNLRAASAVVLSLASLAVVALVLSADGEHEVSLSSFCFFGSCKTPPASAEARWRKEAATKRNDGVPCFMGGACDSPPSTRIRKWQRSVQRKKQIKQMKDALRLKKWGAAQVPVKKHHHKAPQTERQREKATRRDLTLKILARARFLGHRESAQATVASTVHASKLNTQLSKYPKAQKKLKGILGKLSSTETAKVAAAQALKRAQALTKVANKARAGVLSFEKTVTASIAKAKADEKAHKLALLRVQYLEKQSQRAEATFEKIATKSAFGAK